MDDPPPPCCRLPSGLWSGCLLHKYQRFSIQSKCTIKYRVLYIHYVKLRYYCVHVLVQQLYCVSHPLYRRVLELGCGLGLTGLALCKLCSPSSLCFSDTHPRVLHCLRGNVEHNSPSKYREDHCHPYLYYCQAVKMKHSSPGQCRPQNYTLHLFLFYFEHF